MAIRMLQRRGTAAQWEAKNPILGPGEIGIALDVGIIKIGNGVESWVELDIVYEATPAVLSVFGRIGDVEMTSEDITDATAVGLALLVAADQDAVLGVLGASDTGIDILRAAGPNAVRSVLGSTTVGDAVFMAASAAAARSAIGITTVGAGLVTATDAASARTAIGAGTGNGNVTGTGISNVVKVTQAAYDAIGTKDAATLYVIVG